MSINSSIKSGKGINDSNYRLTNMISSSSRERRENVIKKKRGNGSFLDVYNRNQEHQVTVEEVEQYKNTILNPNASREELIESVGFFRKVLSNDRSPPSDLVIQTGIIPLVCQFLRYDDCPELQYECAWVITNICSGTKEQTAVVINSGALPELIRLIDSPEISIREQVIWALGNIAGDCVANRDAIINSGCITNLINGLNDKNATILLIRNTVWLLSNLCRIRDGIQTNFEKVKICLPYLKSYLSYDQEDIAIDACWSFAFVTDGNRANTKYVIQMDVIPIIMQHLGDKNVKMVTPALRAIGNVLSGDDVQTQLCLDNNVLFYLEQLISSTNYQIVKEALWCISNIAAGNESQIQAVLDRNIVPVLIELIFSGRIDIQREACWAICNAFCGGNPQQIYMMMMTPNCIPAISKLIRNGEDVKLLTVIIEALDRCILLGDFLKQQTNSTDNCVKVWMDDCGCLDSLESLTVTDESFYTYLDSFIDKHFGYEDNTLATSNASFNNNVQYICLLYNKHFYSFDSILESHFIISFIQSKQRQGVNI